ncbi:MAG: 6-pyruvoyltetrahydropterin/6-carboxytetrahydropterin synthase [Phycisphaerales bacterium]|jgi:6-pyruvoyltetrahydropterin/6-carboxytetrahydropterin synthase
MVRLSRTVRCNLSPHGPHGPDEGVNGFGGVPAMQGLGSYAEFEVGCEGFPDVATGYLIDIKQIDQAVRGVVFAALARKASSGEPIDPACELLSLFTPLAEDLGARFVGSLRSLRWWLTPTCSLEVSMDDQTQGVVLLRQRSEFAASHRLHVPTMDDAANRELFGKCNNPNGHGHNYVVEPCVEVTPGPGAPALTVPALEAAVDRAILSRFDHKHLNLDTDEFGPDGVNPTVENISKICFELLGEELGNLEGAVLRSVTVWETDRTCCTYPG